MNKKKAILLLTSLFLFSCITSQKKSSIDDPGSNSNQEVNSIDSLGSKIFEAKDIAYGSHSDHKMDVYLPTHKDGPYPVMFQVHGGAWHWGDKSESEYSIEDYRSKGFAFVNINYRMGNMSYTLEEKLDDIEAALEFMYKYKEKWHLSDDLTLIGGSAGGHMVLQYGFTRGLGQVDRIVSYSGPTDLSNPFYASGNINDPIKALFKSKNPSNEELKQASPLYSFPKEPGPPVMMIHGNADKIVDFNDSKRLNQALLDAGWDSSIIEIPNSGHDFKGTDWNWVSSIYSPWLKKHVNY